MSDEAVLLALLIGAGIVILGLAARAIWEHFEAHKQYTVVVPLPGPQVVQIVRKAFGQIFWERVDGPEDFNFRRVVRNQHASIVSIAVRPITSDSTEVAFYLSASSQKFFLTIVTRPVINRRKRLFRLLRRASAEAGHALESSSSPAN